jgi:hypothetical protein
VKDQEHGCESEKGHLVDRARYREDPEDREPAQPARDLIVPGEEANGA